MNKESQRTASTGVHTKTATPPTVQRQTTFLTHETRAEKQPRAPSAYHVQTDGDTIGDSQRARQQHKSGAKLTSEKHRVHAFTQTKQQQMAVSSLTADMASTGQMDAQTALRLNIMDGLASPTAFHGAQHIETSRSAVGKGNPHFSGGTVTFPQTGTPLADFDAVANRTQQMRSQHKKGQTVSPPITGGMDSDPAPAKQFNQAALKEQQRFAQSILKPSSGK